MCAGNDCTVILNNTRRATNGRVETQPIKMTEISEMNRKMV